MGYGSDGPGEVGDVPRVELILGLETRLTDATTALRNHSLAFLLL